MLVLPALAEISQCAVIDQPKNSRKSPQIGHSPVPFSPDSRSMVRA
ncbi:MAG: hypothetical protein JJU24_03465 [Natronohydrobacter sp.]|nr:hypothetical protein [Natronohydrobacter sp.]